MQQKKILVIDGQGGKMGAALVAQLKASALPAQIIAIGANSVERARNYLEMLGCQFDESTAKYENGKLTFIYIAGEVSGFAVHLTQN